MSKFLYTELNRNHGKQAQKAKRRAEPAASHSLPEVRVELSEVLEKVLGEQLAVENIVHAAHLPDAVHGQLGHTDVDGAWRDVA